MIIQKAPIQQPFLINGQMNQQWSRFFSDITDGIGTIWGTSTGLTGTPTPTNIWLGYYGNVVHFNLYYDNSTIFNGETLTLTDRVSLLPSYLQVIDSTGLKGIAYVEGKIINLPIVTTVGKTIIMGSVPLSFV